MIERQKYRLNFSQEQTHVVAKVEGLPEPRPAHDPCYLTKIAEHCFRCGCSAILIDKQTPDPFEVWDAVPAATTLGGIGLPDVRVAVVEAVVDPPPQRQLAVAIGKHQKLHIRIFTETTEAEEWLLSNPVSGEVH